MNVNKNARHILTENSAVLGMPTIKCLLLNGLFDHVAIEHHIPNYNDEVCVYECGTLHATLMKPLKRH